MLLLMALRTPIAIAMFCAGSLGYVAQAGWAPFANFLNAQAFARFASYDLSVIPLFILMGNFASQGGISKSLFEFASSVMARFRGGLAMAAVLASGAFGAICGSSVATAATITSVALPEMRRHGYSGRLATGTLAAGGTLGILIPPSVPLVIYAILAEQNIAKLFAAAMVPGIIAMIGYMIAIAIYVRLVPGQAPEVDDDRPPMSLHALAASCRSRSSSSSSSAASTAASSRRPKAPRSAPPRPSSPRWPSARSPGPSSSTASTRPRRRRR
jgi:tripartite ATP-independent transporter DctM subunit